MPDLTIMGDEDEVLLQWEADPAETPTAHLRFVGQGKVRLPIAEVERALGALVGSVLARLLEELEGNEEVERTVEAWDAIRSADLDEKQLCRSLAMLGVDPYDPDEATPELIQVVERAIGALSAELRNDFFVGSDPWSIQDDLSWVDRARSGLGPPVDPARWKTLDWTSGETAHETGYRLARRVRSELLKERPDEQLEDLPGLLVDRLGWAPDCSREAEGQTRLDGMIGLDATHSAPLLVVANRRSEAADRFRLARAAFFPVAGCLGTTARLLTRSVTRDQRASRAFAAELLAPAAALERRISGWLNEQDVEDLAAELVVSPQVIRHQVENHGLAYLAA